MAFKDIEGSFVRLSEDGIDPRKIPKHYGVFYDKAFKMCQKFGHYGGTSIIPHNLWPIVCLMADMQETIDELSNRLAEMEVDDQVEAFKAAKLKTEASVPQRIEQARARGKKRGRPAKLQTAGV